MSPFHQATVSAVSAALLLGVSLSFGQSIPSPDEAVLADDEVLVESSKNTFAIDSEVLRGTAAIFDKYRLFAPEAPLMFRVFDRRTSVAPLRLWIERGDVIEPLAVGDDRLFSLPPSAFADGARLVANRTEDTLSISSEILSPGMTLRLRRMGDLRLQCRASWSLHLDELPRYLPRRKRPLYAMDGGVCDSAKISYHPYTAGFRVQTAEFRGAAAPKPIKVYTTGPLAGSYVAPLHDRSISDDAIIELK
jgi:hypothetical protein